MPQIKLTPKALADMARLQNFYRAKSPAAYMGAKRVLRDGLQRLSQYPEIGRICPEYPGIPGVDCVVWVFRFYFSICDKR